MEVPMAAFVDRISATTAGSAAEQPAQHNLFQSVMLHLFPGLVALFVYWLLILPFERAGFPSMMAWLVTVALVNIPLEWGIMFIEGYKRNGRLSLAGVVLNRQPLSAFSVLLRRFWSFWAFWLPLLFSRR
jgi:uncharacterized protein